MKFKEIDIMIWCLIFICVCFGISTFLMPKEFRHGIYPEIIKYRQELEELKKEIKNIEEILKSKGDNIKINKINKKYPESKKNLENHKHRYSDGKPVF